MKFISAKDTVEFLSQSAPRVWVHRMLKWMIFESELDAHVDRAIVQPYTSVSHFTANLYPTAKEFSGPVMDGAIREKFSPEIAEKLVGKAHGDRFVYEEYTIEGREEIGPLDIGFIMFATNVEWEAGTIKVEWIDEAQLASDILFPRQEFIGSEFERPNYEIRFEGLKFGANRIELLLPNAALDTAKEILARVQGNFIPSDARPNGIGTVQWPLFYRRPKRQTGFHQAMVPKHALRK